MNQNCIGPELSARNPKSTIIESNDVMFSRFGKFTSSRFAIRKNANKLNHPQYKYIKHFVKHKNVIYKQLDYLVKDIHLEKDLISIFDTKHLQVAPKNKKGGQQLTCKKQAHVKKKCKRTDMNSMSACFKSQDRTFLEMKQVILIRNSN